MNLVSSKFPSGSSGSFDFSVGRVGHGAPITSSSLSGWVGGDAK